jgi:hypothetical protein
VVGTYAEDFDTGADMEEFAHRYFGDDADESVASALCEKRRKVSQAAPRRFQYSVLRREGKSNALAEVREPTLTHQGQPAPCYPT